MRPVDQHAAVAQCRESAAILAYGLQGEMRHAQRWTGTPPHRRAGTLPLRLAKNAAAFVSYAGHRAKCGSGRGSSRTFGFAAATAQTPSSPRRNVMVRPLSRNATALVYAPQSTTKGKRPGRSTSSLKASIATSAHGIIQRTNRSLRAAPNAAAAAVAVISGAT